MNVAASSNFAATAIGIAWPAHAGLVRPASMVQRALMQGSVVVVVVAKVVVVVGG